jgi:hypothetical protein
MPRSTPGVVVSEDQQKQIEQWLAALGTPQQGALRGRMVLAAGLGKSEAAIAAEMNVNRKTVRLWRERFVAQGLPGLWEIAPGRGRKATHSTERIKVHAAIETERDDSLELSAHGSESGYEQVDCEQPVAKSQHQAAPHQDIQALGLYLNSPDQAIVLSVDEKSQIQALNRAL